jgi:hypothetical protein
MEYSSDTKTKASDGMASSMLEETKEGGVGYSMLSGGDLLKQ